MENGRSSLSPSSYGLKANLIQAQVKFVLRQDTADRIRSGHLLWVVVTTHLFFYIRLGLCLIASIGQLSAGMSLGFSAVTLPYMLEKDSYIYITGDQASWIASITAIAIPFGCLVSGPILDRWGRKTGLLLVNLPALIGWLFIALQPDLVRLFIGRAVTGFACGLASVPATVYFAEVSTKSMRGLLLSGTSIAIGAGVLIVYILGYFLKSDWRMIAAICAVFPVSAAVLITIFLPESPMWLISKGLNKQAYASLQYVRGVPTAKQVQAEMNSMLEQSRSNRKNKLTAKEMVMSFLYPEVYKPFVIMVLYFLFQQFSGIFVIIFYAVDVVNNSGITADPYLVSIGLAVVRVIFTLIAAWMSKRFGRRPPSIISGLGMTLSLFILLLHLNHINSDDPREVVPTNNTNESYSVNSTVSEVTVVATSISWVPLISILCYVLFSTIGFLTLPWAIIGEIFPSRVRGITGGLTTCIAYVASFITVKSYPVLVENLHQNGVYLIFGIVSLIGTLFVIFFLPETQGKTLQEIEQYFSKRDACREPSQDRDDSQENKLMLSPIVKPIVQPKV